MPTYSAKADRQARGLEGGISLFKNSGTLLPIVHSILELIKSHDMVLATGHVSTTESIALVSEARDISIQRVVVTQGTTHYVVLKGV